MLANVTVDGQPIATARFMGGREYEVISQNARVPVSAAALRGTIERGQFALPSFAPAGPFLRRHGRLAGPAPGTEQERTALATLYVAGMIAFVLDLLGSRNDIVIDGGLARNLALVRLVAALRPGQRVLRSETAEGTALGTAALAFEALGKREPFRSLLEDTEPLEKIAAAIRTAKLRARRVLAIYQPHGYGPTRFLRRDFVAAFSRELGPDDRLFMLEVFYAGGAATRDFSSADIVAEIAALGTNAEFAPSRNWLVGRVAQEVRPGDLVLVMGARDPSLSELARAMLARIKSPQGAAAPAQ